MFLSWNIKKLCQCFKIWIDLIYSTTYYLFILISTWTWMKCSKVSEQHIVQNIVIGSRKNNQQMDYYLLYNQYKNIKHHFNFFINYWKTCFNVLNLKIMGVESLTFFILFYFVVCVYPSKDRPIIQRKIIHMKHIFHS